MNRILLEEFPTADMGKFESDWWTFKTKVSKERFVKETLVPFFRNEFKDDKLVKLVIRSIVKYGFDELRNLFLAYLYADNLPLNFENTKQYPYFEAAYDLFDKKKLKVIPEVLMDSESYNRDVSDFKYTVITITNHEDPNWIKHHYKNADSDSIDPPIGPEALYEDGAEDDAGNKISTRPKSAPEIREIVAIWEQGAGVQHTENFDLVDAYNKIQSYEDRKKFIRSRFLTLPTYKRHKAIHNLIMDSILEFGIEESDNAFLRLVLSLPFSADDNNTHKEMFKYIYAAYKNKRLDLTLEVLKNPTLYQRTVEEFKYTLNAFVMFSKSKNYGVYIKDTSVVDISQFMDGNTVKPAGSEGDVTPDTIWGVVQIWSTDNEYSKEERASRGRVDNVYSLSSVLGGKAGVSYENLLQIAKKYATSNGKDAESVDNFLYTALVLPDLLNQLQGKKCNPRLIVDDSINVQSPNKNDLKNAVMSHWKDVTHCDAFFINQPKGYIEFIAGPLGAFIVHSGATDNGKLSFVATREESLIDKLSDSIVNMEVRLENKDKRGEKENKPLKASDFSRDDIINAVGEAIFNVLENGGLKILQQIWG